MSIQIKKQQNATQNYRFSEDINVIAIARLSTKERQAMNPDTRMEHSIDEQQKKIEDFVKKSSEINQIDRQLIFHGSAFNNSEYINDFTNILKSNKNKVFLFVRVDRCSRNESYFVEWKKLCRQFHHRLIFIDDNITYPSDNFGIERNLSDLVLTAQQYSVQISKNAKQVAERKRKRKNDDSIKYQNSSAFGRSFTYDRKYEIHMLLITQRLLSINDHNPLKLTELNELLAKIIQTMPIIENEKMLKMNYLSKNPIEMISKDEQKISILNDPLTFDEIVKLFDDYAVTHVHTNEEIPIFSNSSKLLIKNKLISENLYSIIHRKNAKGRIIEITLTDVVKQFFPDQEIENYINECFELNQQLFPNLSCKSARKLKLKLNTILSLPDTWNVPELNIPTDKQLKLSNIYCGKFINIESEYESFNKKCDLDEEFKKKVTSISDNLNQLFQNLTVEAYNNDDVNTHSKTVEEDVHAHVLKKKKEEISFSNHVSSENNIASQVWMLLQNKDTSLNKEELNSYLTEIGLSSPDDIEFLESAQISRIQLYLKPVQQKKFDHLMNQIKNH
jgi:DNA invertase Pin-like site-specific DNA recombinase